MSAKSKSKGFTKKEIKETKEQMNECRKNLKSLSEDIKENGGKPEHRERINNLNREYLQLSNKIAKIELWIYGQQDAKEKQ